MERSGHMCHAFPPQTSVAGRYEKSYQNMDCLMKSSCLPLADVCGGKA